MLEEEEEGWQEVLELLAMLEMVEVLPKVLVGEEEFTLH